MSKPDGGAAFPRDWSAGHKGMTLRDYFAGQWLAGVMADPSYNASPRVAAAYAYAAADSMIAERDK